MAAFDELKAMIQGVKEAKPQELTNCPICDWSLEKEKQTGILHCPFCGWHNVIKPKAIL